VLSSIPSIALIEPFLQAAVESVTKIQALELHIEQLEDTLGTSEARRADLQVHSCLFCACTRTSSPAVAGSMNAMLSTLTMCRRILTPDRMQAELDNREAMFDDTARQNQIFSHLLANIQEQITGAGSRPGSAASGQSGHVNAEAMIGAVRQSLGAPPLIAGPPPRTPGAAPLQ
jgi:hypothetical protein